MGKPDIKIFGAQPVADAVGNSGEPLGEFDEKVLKALQELAGASGSLEPMMATDIDIEELTALVEPVFNLGDAVFVKPPDDDIVD